MNESTLMISPTNQEFFLKAGETTTGSLKIVNPNTASGNLHYKIRVFPYSVNDGNYDIDFSTESTYTAIANWVKFDSDEGALPPSASTDVSFSINVPDNAPPGGQYAVIIVSTAPSTDSADSTAGVERVFEIASVLYASVDGEIIHSGQIISNNIPFLSSDPKLVTEISLDNTGNIHERAIVTLTVSDYLSGENLYTGGSEGNLADVIYPGTNRSLQKEVYDLPSVALLNVEQSVEYLGNTSTTKRLVVVCPVWLILVITLVICTLITLLVLRIRRRFKEKHAPTNF